MTGSPAGPTEAPMGSVAATASVARAGSRGAALSVDVVVVDSDPSVEAEESVELAESAGAAVAGATVAESPELDRSIDWNWTPERLARFCSCTKRLAWSLSAGAALPNTTRRR